MNDYLFPYWGGLFLKTTITKKLQKELLDKGKKIIDEKLNYRKELAGMIDKEYFYPNHKNWFEPYMETFLNLYENKYMEGWQQSTPHIKKPFNIIDSQLWINFQKANEYNPRHNHSGWADLSFVMYLQIPEVLKKENEQSKDKYNNSGAGAISFYSGDPLPFSINGFSELPKERDMFIFPSWMMHSVNAFKSDVERISVAGNITLEKND